MPSSLLILCHPLLLPRIPPSIRVFSNESTLRMRWPQYWTFSFSISACNEHLGLISFRMDWLDLLVVQGTLKSLLQLHSSKASILQCSAFFIVQLSHPYMTTGKTIALTRWIFLVLANYVMRWNRSHVTMEGWSWSPPPGWLLKGWLWKLGHWAHRGPWWQARQQGQGNPEASGHCGGQTLDCTHLAVSRHPPPQLHQALAKRKDSCG